MIEYRFDSLVVGFKGDIIIFKNQKIHSVFQYEKNSYAYNNIFSIIKY